ncbi:MAG: hypothetical protein LUP91_13010, partial [Methylococcaceae bacterium]|nr:hypothetical protein [Methylococcaceae bacterium]
MALAATALQRDHFVWGLGAMCQLHRVPFDPKLVLQQFPPPYSVERFLHAAKTFGFRAGVSRVSRERLTRLPLPCLVALAPAAAHPSDSGNDSANDPQAAPAASPERGLALVFRIEDEKVLLVKADAERVLYFRAGSEKPETLLLSEFSKHIRTDILLVAREVAQVV